MQFLRADAGARSVTVALTDVLRKVEAPASNLLRMVPAVSGGLSTTHPSERSMNALPNTRDAIGDSWSTTSRRARRMARHGREAAEDIGSELRTLLSELESTLSEGTQADAAALRAQISEPSRQRPCTSERYPRGTPRARWRRVWRRGCLSSRKALADDCARRRVGARRGRVARARALTFQSDDALQKIRANDVDAIRADRIDTPCASKRARAGSFTV